MPSLSAAAAAANERFFFSSPRRRARSRSRARGAVVIATVDRLNVSELITRDGRDEKIQSLRLCISLTAFCSSIEPLAAERSFDIRLPNWESNRARKSKRAIILGLLCRPAADSRSTFENILALITLAIRLDRIELPTRNLRAAIGARFVRLMREFVTLLRSVARPSSRFESERCHGDRGTCLPLSFRLRRLLNASVMH